MAGIDCLGQQMLQQYGMQEIKTLMDHLMKTLLELKKDQDQMKLVIFGDGQKIPGLARRLHTQERLTDLLYEKLGIKPEDIQAFADKYNAAVKEAVAAIQPPEQIGRVS